MKGVRAVLFDAGGTLIHVDGPRVCQAAGVGFAAEAFRAADTVIVQCEAPPAVAMARYRERSGSRHKAHFDAERIQDAERLGEAERAALDVSHYGLDLTARLLHVDTSGPQPHPSVAEISKAVRP